jgi:putative ABC transport system substrate-binding protein
MIADEKSRAAPQAVRRGPIEHSGNKPLVRGRVAAVTRAFPRARGRAREPMRRRDFLAAAGVAAAWTRPAKAEQRRVPAIGYLYPGSLAEGQDNLAAFRDGLAQEGYVEGRNVTFEFREAKDDLALLPELARDLVRRQVDVILAPANGASLRAARAATATIPIVFSFGGDPLKSGLVTSLSRPGGNITGVADFDVALSGKRLELIKLLVPAIATVAYLAAPGQPQAEREIANATEHARTLGVDVSVIWVSNVAEIDAAFATLAQKRVDAVCLMTHVLFFGHRARVVGLAARHRLPTVYPFIQYTQIGGLVSYGASLMDRSYQAGVYVGLILNGQKPGDLPVRRLTRFELAINMTTAKTLGLTVPARFLALTDKVIE